MCSWSAAARATFRVHKLSSIQVATFPVSVSTVARNMLDARQQTRCGPKSSPTTARAGNRRKGRFSALRAHTKAPYKMNFHKKTLVNTKAA